MSEPFLAEVRMVGFNFAPRGWAFCDGQILPINQNQSLFSLLGTTYGGDGRSSFALPELRGRTPMHVGDAPFTILGGKAGEENHSLVDGEMPRHRHQPRCSQQTTGASSDPTGNLWSPVTTTVGNMFADPAQSATDQPMNNPIQNAGSGTSHNNEQPSLVIGFVIALKGSFPSRN